jgi:hypothetical protein
VGQFALRAEVPTDRNLKPHVRPIAVYIADSQNNRIVQIEWPTSASSSPNPGHGYPPVVTEFIPGLADPWDIVEHAEGDEFIISERVANRIVAYDKAGQFKRVVLQHDPLNPVECYLNKGPRVMGLRGGDVTTRLEVARQHPVLGPEGLYILDGWLYFGSHALKQVRRLHLKTGELQVVCEVLHSSRFVKFAVSDGTFGPRGAVAIQTWSIMSAHQDIYLPDGSTWHLSRSVPWDTVLLSQFVMAAWSREHRTMGYAATVPACRSIAPSSKPERRNLKHCTAASFTDRRGLATMGRRCRGGAAQRSTIS